MAPHLSQQELDWIQRQRKPGEAVGDLHERFGKFRARKDLSAPHITQFRKILKGLTYRRGVAESRGRKRTLKPSTVRRMNQVRKTLSKKWAGKRPVLWKDIIKTAKAPSVSRTTALHAFQRQGIKVALRPAREKPQRTPEQAEERMAYCKANKHRTGRYFDQQLDFIMDNKRFDIPLSERAREYMAKQKITSHLRTPSEGLQPEFTKPGKKKNKFNTGASVNICAGISNGKIVLWHELPKVWNGKEAAALYAGAIIKCLKKHRGTKRKYLVLEDNDPTGYKSNAAKRAKELLKINAVQFPTYSPDLNPLDFSLWAEVEKRIKELVDTRVAVDRSGIQEATPQNSLEAASVSSPQSCACHPEADQAGD